MEVKQRVIASSATVIAVCRSKQLGALNRWSICSGLRGALRGRVDRLLEDCRVAAQAIETDVSLLGPRGLHGDAAERAVAKGWTRCHRTQECGETKRAFLIQINAAASSGAASVFGLQPG